MTHTEQFTYISRSVICGNLFFFESLIYSRPPTNGSYYTNPKCYGQCYLHGTCSSSFITRLSRCTHIISL